MVSNYGLKPQNSKIVRGTYIRRQTSLQNSESSNTEKMPNQKMLHRRKIITPVESLLLPTVSSTTSSSSGFHSDSLKHTNSSHSDNSSDSPTENFQVGSFFKSDSRRNSNFSHARLRTISYDVCETPTGRKLTETEVVEHDHEILEMPLAYSMLNLEKPLQAISPSNSHSSGSDSGKGSSDSNFPRKFKSVQDLKNNVRLNSLTKDKCEKFVSSMNLPDYNQQVADSRGRSPVREKKINGRRHGSCNLLTNCSKSRNNLDRRSSSCDSDYLYYARK